MLWNQTSAGTVAFGTWPALTTVTPIGVGRYQVKFPGQGAPNGVVHVTAVNNAPHWCQAETWFQSGPDELVNIRCYKVGGVLDPSSFSAFFVRASGGPSSGPYGYVDSTATGALVSQFNSTGAPNTSTPGGTGQWLVRFPGLVTGGPLDGSLQATAVNSATGARCKVAGWASTGGGQDVKVLCFNSAGALLNTRFTLTYQYKVSLYGAAIPPKYFGLLRAEHVLDQHQWTGFDRPRCQLLHQCGSGSQHRLHGECQLHPLGERTRRGSKAEWAARGRDRLR